MTDDNSNASDSNIVDMDDLASFKETFFSDKPVATDEPPVKEDENEQEVNETEDDALATGEDEGGEPNEPEAKPKAKKSYQERINELTAARREAERREDELRQRIAQLEASKPEVKTEAETPKPLRQQLPDGAPDPDAKDESGEPVYRLGEFDPAYIRDLTRFTITQETEAAKAEAAKSEHQKMVETAQDELKSSWFEKVNAAEENLPDIKEKLLDMGRTFEGIEPQYGEFLAATIMSCDNGPEIMYYLSQNIGEAQKIVASGPAAATRALGRLDAKFDKPTETTRNTSKVSNAPKPPVTPTRGQGGRFATPADTEDLAAFKREFFKK